VHPSVSNLVLHWMDNILFVKPLINNYK